MTGDPRGAPDRALVLAGGGIRVAWQAGAVQALDEAGLTFDHGDGTSGGIFTLGMLLSGVTPSELGARWRTLPARRFVGFLPLRSYLRLPTSWPAVGSASGVVDHVLPHLGIDVARIRTSDVMTGVFNVADFDTKRCVPIPHHEIDGDRLVAGVSLPIFMPAVKARGRTWTDAVWIRDANPLDAVRRGCNEAWLLWCIGNTTRWGTGALEQYVHMIELAANGALFDDLERIAEINERRAAGETVHGSTDPVVVHVVVPEVPLPLDPEFVAGRIDAETLVAMGYRDAWRYLRARTESGSPLDPSVTRMTDPPPGARIPIRVSGQLSAGGGHARSAGPVSLRIVIEARDIAGFVADSTRPGGASTPAVGGIDLAGVGYRPFVDATFRATPGDRSGDRRFSLDATVRIDGEECVFTAHGGLPAGTGRWSRASRVTLELADASGATSATGEGRMRGRDALRTLVGFEPTGCHGLVDRARVARRATHLLRT